MKIKSNINLSKRASLHQGGSKSHLVNTKQRKVNFSFSRCFESGARRGIKGLFYDINKFARRHVRIHAFGASSFLSSGGSDLREKA